MPVADDWKTCPHNLVNKIYNTRHEQENWESNISSTFKDLLSCENTWNSLPSLNHLPNHEVTDGQLVRFRGMVQDMLDPEIYLAEYEIRNLASGTSSIQCGRYRDILQNGMREEILQESHHNKMKDRGIVYCVSIPGESAWVSQLHAARCTEKAGPSGTVRNPLKRILEPASAATNGLTSLTAPESMEMDTDSPTNTTSSSAILNGGVDGKRSKGEDGGAVMKNNVGVPASDNNRHDLNLPIPNATGKAVIVKLYDIEDGSIKLNQILDIVGIVSLDPSLANIDDPDDQAGTLPPPSLVPRVHAVHIKKVEQNNPLVVPGTHLTQEEMTRTREQIIYILTQALLGDSLAAEYLLYHLISKVYGRRDIQVLGKMGLNLFNLNNNNNWIKRLYTILGLLVPGSHYLPLSRQHLETNNFVPAKDFEANRLVSGLLQLPASTNLVVDETMMSDGQLNPRGLSNLTAVGNLIRWQKLDYDFKYHSLEYETDVSVLVLSEGRSLLPADFQIKVIPEESLLESNYRNVNAILSEDLLNRIRVYLTQCREADYDLPEAVQTAVTDDFVQLRQEDPNQFTPEDLHSHLILARLVALSHGKPSLEAEDWSKVKELEANRKANRTPQPRGQPSLPNGLPLSISAI